MRSSNLGAEELIAEQSDLDFLNETIKKNTDIDFIKKINGIKKKKRKKEKKGKKGENLKL